MGSIKGHKVKTVYRLDGFKIARLVGFISYLVIGLALFSSCEIEDVPCEICSNNYDREGVFIGTTCTPIRCCELYYPYECNDF